MRHGGDIAEAVRLYGRAREHWLDLSTGINPHAYPIPADDLSAEIARLPDSGDLKRLNTAARSTYRVPEGAGIVPAPGSQAIIQWLPVVLAGDGPVAIVAPTYGEHGETWRRAGRTVVEIDNPSEAPPEAAIVVVCNPNNPDGRFHDADALRPLADRLRRSGGWLVVDEAFVDLCPKRSLVGLAADYPVVILRSFGKFFGLAGLRLGFALAPAALADRLMTALGPWAVSAPAFAAGMHALGDDAWQTEMRARLKREADELDRTVARAGLTEAGGTALYRLYRAREAGALHRRLAEQGIWTRVFDDRDDWIRLGLPGSPERLARLADALSRRHEPADGT